jgi:hypothetical protein
MNNFQKIYLIVPVSVRCVLAGFKLAQNNTLRN